MTGLFFLNSQKEEKVLSAFKPGKVLIMALSINLTLGVFLKRRPCSEELDCH